MITLGQIIAIIVASLGAVIWLLAMVAPNLEALFANWRIKLTAVIVGFLMVVGGMWATPYFAHKPKTLIESGQQTIVKGRESAQGAWKRTIDWYNDWRLWGTDPAQKKPGAPQK